MSMKENRLGRGNEQPTWRTQGRNKEITGLGVSLRLDEVPIKKME